MRTVKDEQAIAPPQLRPANDRAQGMAQCAEQFDVTRIDAIAAHDCIVGLLELLHGCPAQHQVTAGPLAALLGLVHAYQANVVDGMR